MLHSGAAAQHAIRRRGAQDVAFFRIMPILWLTERFGLSSLGGKWTT
jgi:hypothetical protein